MYLTIFLQNSFTMWRGSADDLWKVIASKVFHKVSDLIDISSLCLSLLSHCAWYTPSLNLLIIFTFHFSMWKILQVAYGQRSQKKFWPQKFFIKFKMLSMHNVWTCCHIVYSIIMWNILHLSFYWFLHVFLFLFVTERNPR